MILRPAALAAAAGLLALAGPLAAPAAADQRDDMYSQLGVGTVGADYLFLVDESGSMRESFPALRTALTDFTGHLDPADRVALIPFSAQADSRPWYAATSAEATAAVDALPDPAASGTDFFAALSWAVTHLGSDTDAGGRVATVVLLTDGDPNGGGLAPCELPDASTWQPVRSQAEALAQVRPVNAYAIPIPGTAKSCTDTPVSILQNVFPAAEQLSAGGDTAAYLQQAKQNAQASKAQQLLVSRGELTKTVTVAWPAGDRAVDPASSTVRLPVKLSVSGLGPVTVTNMAGLLTMSVKGAGDPRDVRQPFTATPATVTVTPGKPADVVLAAHVDQPGGGFWRHTLTAAGTATFQATVTAPWLDLAGGGLPARLTTTITPAQADVSGAGASGVIRKLWAVLAVIAFVAVFAAATYGFWRWPEMAGSVSVRAAGEDADVSVDGKRRARRTVGPGAVVLTGRRNGTEPKIHVQWTTPAGTSGKLVSRGGSVMIGGVSFRHHL